MGSKPKPVANVAPPVDPQPRPNMKQSKAMDDLPQLAFETDSNLSITLMLHSVGTLVAQILGVTMSDDYYKHSHHGNAEKKSRN